MPPKIPHFWPSFTAGLQISLAMKCHNTVQEALRDMLIINKIACIKTNYRNATIV